MERERRSPEAPEKEAREVMMGIREERISDAQDLKELSLGVIEGGSCWRVEVEVGGSCRCFFSWASGVFIILEPSF